MREFAELWNNDHYNEADRAIATARTGKYDDIKQRQKRWWPMAITDFIWNREFFSCVVVVVLWLFD